jgi:dihydrofolate synthase/folylpolyglutamate synthase
VFRPQHPAICGDAQPPLSLQDAAELIGADWHALGHDFNYQVNSDGWDYDGVQKYLNLPLPTMRGDCQINNAATAIAALSYFGTYCLVDEYAIRRGLQTAQVTGRFQVIAQAPMRILDVAHNPHGAEALAANLVRQSIVGKTYAVFSMLSDKDITGVIAEMRDVIDVWVIAGLDVPRGAKLEALQAQLHALHIPVIVPKMDVRSAWFYACEHAAENDRICAFGSFYTVAAVLDAVKQEA